MVVQILAPISPPPSPSLVRQLFPARGGETIEHNKFLLILFILMKIKQKSSTNHFEISKNIYWVMDETKWSLFALPPIPIPGVAKVPCPGPNKIEKIDP